MKELIFEEISFTNFKCHEEMAFSFTPNRFCVITGNNGSGKTSIFDALCYALYDVTTKGLKGDNVIRKKAGKNLSINLKFKIDDDLYEIRNYRKHHKYGDNKFLFFNGKDITENSRKETNEKITQLLMPQEIFTNCLLFSQFINKSFTELTHSGQKDILDKILNLEKYDMYLEMVNQSIKQYKNDISKYEDLIIAYEKQLFSFQELLEQTKVYRGEIIKRYETEERKIENDIKELQQYVIKNQDRVNEYLEKERERDKIKQELNEVLAELDKRRQQCLIDLQSCKNKFKEQQLSQKDEFVKKCDDTNSKLNDKKNNLSNKIISYKEKINDTRTKFIKFIDDYKRKKKTELEKKLKELRDEKNKLDEKERQISKEEQTITSQYEKNKKIIEEYESALSQEIPICSVCKQEIKNEEHRNNIQNQIDRLKIQVETDEIRLQQRKKEIEQYKKLRDSIEKDIKKEEDTYETKINKISQRNELKLGEYIEKINKRIVIIQKQIIKYEEVINKNKAILKTKLENLHSKLETQCNEEMEKIKFIAKQNAETYVNKKEDLEKQLETYNNIIKELEGVYLKVNSCHTSIKLKKEQIENNKSKLSTELENNDNTIQSLSEKINIKEREINELKTNIETKNKKNEILTFWKSAFSDTGIKSILLDEAIPILNERARELSNLTDCIKVSFDSQSVLKSGDMRDKFSINVLQTRNLSNFMELSAGETRMANIIVLLCLRHLMETIQGFKMNILLLDEILDTLDQENAALAVSMIKQLAQTHCVVLISHTLRNFIDADEELTL